MTITMNNGSTAKVRKSLAHEIDRLDRVLDGLSEGLNEAVADAVKAAVETAIRETVQAVLTEMLTNTEVLAKLHALVKPNPTSARSVPRTTLWQRLGRLCQRVRACLAELQTACAARLTRIQIAIDEGWQRTLQRVAAIGARLQIVRRFKWQLLTALGIGATVGVATWFAGPWVSALVSGVGGFGSTLAAQGGLWLRRMLSLNDERIA